MKTDRNMRNVHNVLALLNMYNVLALLNMHDVLALRIAEPDKEVNPIIIIIRKCIQIYPKFTLVKLC